MTIRFLQVLTTGLVMGLATGLASCQQEQAKVRIETCSTALYILGTAQDAGKPQIGHSEDPAWQNPDLIRTASSLGLVDKDTGSYVLFDATPDIKFQMYALENYSAAQNLHLGGIFLTHGHMGHYLGLAQFGREAMGAKAIPVYAMPRMQNFLENNGPWDLLVKLKNIDIKPLTDGTSVTASGATITPFLVPHRGEYTETVGFRIQGAGKSAIYLPDIDNWQEWEAMGTKLEDIIGANDYLFIDGTFYNGDELPGRDMSKIPHPTMVSTMEYLKTLGPRARSKVLFTHLNHSNPAHDKHTTAYEDVEKAGYRHAQAGGKFCLD